MKIENSIFKMKLIKLQMEFVFIKLTLFLTMVVHKFNVSATVLPSFDRQNENVTVIIGNYAVLPCFISNLGDHKVSLFFSMIYSFYYMKEICLT